MLNTLDLRLCKCCYSVSPNRWFYVRIFEPGLSIFAGVGRLSRVVRVRYENGVLKPLEPLELKDGEELVAVIKDKSFYQFVKSISIEAKEGIDKVLEEVRKRGKILYQ